MLFFFCVWSFDSDLSFLLSPPEDFGEVSGVLKRWVSKMWVMANAFSDSLGYLKGFESFLLTVSGFKVHISL